MNNKLLATAIASTLLGAGATATLTTDTAKVTDLKVDKSTILQENIWLSARLGEAPTLDLSVVSTEEMTAAYVAAVNEKQADTKKLNLYTALREKAVALGVSCITK